MRKNRSFKENSFARSRGSRGKEISIQLDKARPTPAVSTRYDESSRNTDRLNASQWQHNPSLSHNILKEIINYSNISNSTTMRRQPATIAVFDKSAPSDNVLSQLAKISKKAGQNNSRKQTKRLTLDFVENKENKQEKEMIEMSKSLALVDSTSQQCLVGRQESFSGCKSVSICQLSQQQRMQLELERSQSATYLQQLTILQESIQNQHSEMMPFWERMLSSEQTIATYDTLTQRLQQSLSIHRSRLQDLNISLLNTNKQFLISRRDWDSRGTGARAQIVEEAQAAQEQFLRRMTVRDFADTVLFNMKVAIPEYKGKTSLRGIYEELFRSRSAKKFTMILKKHSAHMDLYDGRLLADFTKRINDLEGLFLKADADARHPDQPFLDHMAQIVADIEQERTATEREEAQAQESRQKLQAAREEQRACEQSIHQLIDQMNSQVRGEYERETEKEADFKALLLSKTISKYREFRSIREKKTKTSLQLTRIQEKLLGVSPINS